MRGKVVSERRRNVSSGITPAYAGKRLCELHNFQLSQDHPRLCGEKLVVVILFLTFLRITPAYAGKSGVRYVGMLAKEDHPRLCGEKYLRRDASSMPMGSPPPMRGKGHG